MELLQISNRVSTACLSSRRSPPRSRSWRGHYRTRAADSDTTDNYTADTDTADSRLRWFECTSHTYVSKCFSWVLFLTLTLTRFLISIPPGIIKRRPTDLCSTWGRCWTRRARRERQHSHRGQVWDHLNALLPLSQSNLSVQNVWRCWEGKVEMKWHIDGDRFRTLQAD